MNVKDSTRFRPHLGVFDGIIAAFFLHGETLPVTMIMMMLVMLVPSLASATKIIWKGGGETSAWSDGSNWESGIAPGSGDSAVVPSGVTAKWIQTDAMFLNTLAGIELIGDMEVSGMTEATELTVPLSGPGVFRGLNDGGDATTQFLLTLNNNNEKFTGTFAFTNCGVRINHNFALGGASTRCTLIWNNGQSGYARRLYLNAAGPHNANMFLAQPNYATGMIFAPCDAATYLDGDIDLVGAVQFNANNRSKGLHIRGRLTNSGKAAYQLQPHVYLEGDVDLQYGSANQHGESFYIGGGNGNIKNLGKLFVKNGIHFAAPNVLGGSNPGDMCYYTLGNNVPLVLYLDGNDQNWYCKPYAYGFIINSTTPATLRMMDFRGYNQTFDTADFLTGYASFDVCATNASNTRYTTTVKNTHCTTRGGLMCGAGTFVIGDSAASGITTSFSNLTSLVAYDSGTMKIYNTAMNPENGITNLSVLGTSKTTIGDGVTIKSSHANFSSSATLSIGKNTYVTVAQKSYLDGIEMYAGVYGKVGGVYEDGSPIPVSNQLPWLVGDGWLKTNGRHGMIVSFR